MFIYLKPKPELTKLEDANQCLDKAIELDSTVATVQKYITLKEKYFLVKITEKRLLKCLKKSLD